MLGRSPLESRGSLFGVCRNPYDLERTTAGSSGGSAAAISASFGMVALGTDTGEICQGLDFTHLYSWSGERRLHCTPAYYLAGKSTSSAR